MSYEIHDFGTLTCDLDHTPNPVFKTVNRLTSWGRSNDRSSKKLWVWIDFPHPELHTLIKSLDTCMDVESWVVPKIKHEPLYYQVLKLKECSLWWYKNCHKPFASPYFIMRECLSKGPAFADYLDDLLKYSLRISSGLAYTHVKKDDGIAIEIEDIDEIFSPVHLIMFKRPESGDIELLFEKKDKIQPDLLEEFKDEARKYFKAGIVIEEPDDVDKLRYIGQQTVYEPETNSRVPKKCELLSEGLKITDTFLFDYVQVDKNPHESRDAVVGTLETVHTMKLLEDRLKQVLEVPGELIRNPRHINMIGEHLSCTRKHLYYMSDQKKCGLTFPLELITTLFDVASEFYPDARFDLVHGYDKALLNYKGLKRPITGGPGLGQMNFAVSCCVAILFHLYKNTFSEMEINLEGWFYNDDQVLRIEVDPFPFDPDPIRIQAFEVFEGWDSYMKKFKLTIHSKKPYASIAGILLEKPGDHYPLVYRKLTQRIGNAFNTLILADICSAKTYFSELYDSTPKEFKYLLENILVDTIIPFWGYEFTDKEVNLPFKFGGWINTYNEEGEPDFLYKILEVPRDKPGMLLLPFVYLKEPTKGVKTGGVKYDHLRSVVIKNFAKFEDEFTPPYMDYCKVVRKAYETGRCSTKAHIQCKQEYLKQRMKKVRSYSEKDFNLVIEELTSRYHELLENSTKYIKVLRGMLTDLASEEDYIPCSKDFTSTFNMRTWLRIKGLDKTFNIKNHKDGNDLPCLWADIIKNSIPEGVYVTPRQLNSVLLYKYEKIQKFIFNLWEHGMDSRIPKAPYILPEIEAYWGSSNLDNYIYITKGTPRAVMLTIGDLNCHDESSIESLGCIDLQRRLYDVSVIPVEVAQCKSLSNFMDKLYGVDDDLVRPNMNQESSQANESLTQEDYNLIALITQVKSVAFTKDEVFMREEQHQNTISDEAAVSGLYGQIFGWTPSEPIDPGGGSLFGVVDDGDY